MIRKYFTALVMVGFLVTQPVFAIAGEHGGKEDTGAHAKEMSQHSQKERTLLEAADLSRETRPDLALELEAIAGHKMHGKTKEHGG